MGKGNLVTPFPIRNVLWAGNRPDHYDHIHVDCNPPGVGTPPNTRPETTPGILHIVEALNVHFPGWESLGIYNRRKIAGSNVWSQHAYANALDIGPLYGAEQEPIYTYLTTGEIEVLNTDEEKFVRSMYQAVKEGYRLNKDNVWTKGYAAESNAAVFGPLVDLVRTFSTEDAEKVKRIAETNVEEIVSATITELIDRLRQ